MKHVIVRDIVIGDKIPKICVPVIGRNEEEIYEQAVCAAGKSPDLIEWRADWFAGVQEPEVLQDVLKNIRKRIGNIPLLYTYRTPMEGGRQAVTESRYEEMAVCAAAGGYVDLVDIEAFFQEEITIRLLKKLRMAGVKAILSNHNFDKTPKKDEIIKILRKMQSYQPDIIKFAAMPAGLEDVFSLMLAAEEMNRFYAEVPVITMSMGKTGSISRFAGELSKSAVTFASVSGASAPGQAGIEDTRTMLHIMHKILESDS